VIKKTAVILIIGLAGAGYAQQVSGDSLVKMLEHAKTFYNGGEYEKAITELEKALTFLKQLNQIDQVEAYKYLAFSYVAFGETEKAKEQFRKALALDPKLELDPLTVSPKIIKVFEEVKSEIAVSPPVTPPVKPPVKPVPAEGRSCFSMVGSCCLPGLGQKDRGEGGKGIMLMTATGVLLSSSIISTLVMDAKHQAYLDVEPGDPDAIDDAYKAYKRWDNIAVTSWICLAGVYLYNAYDMFFSKAKTGSSMNELFKDHMYCDVDAGHVSLGYIYEF
jgi:tetratricopeptide (TPR) repeat protein